MPRIVAIRSELAGVDDIDYPGQLERTRTTYDGIRGLRFYVPLTHQRVMYRVIRALADARRAAPR